MVPLRTPADRYDAPAQVRHRNRIAVEVRARGGELLRIVIPSVTAVLSRAMHRAGRQRK